MTSILATTVKAHSVASTLSCLADIMVMVCMTVVAKSAVNAHCANYIGKLREEFDGVGLVYYIQQVRLPYFLD